MRETDHPWKGKMASVHTTERDYYIDFAKGIAVFIMAWGHTMYYTQWLPHNTVEYAFLWAFSELSMPIFVLASGMNVVSQVKRMKADSSWRPTLAFLGSIAWLFMLGFIYNINRRSLGLMDLFHMVAMGTALAFIVSRREWPTWSIIGLSAGIFGVSAVLSLDAIPISTEILKNFDYTRFLKRPSDPFIAQAVTNITMGELKKKAVLEFPLWRRILHIHFALIPWAGFFLTGVVLKRLRNTMWEWVLVGVSLALFVVTFLTLPTFVPVDDFGFYQRSRADYIARLLFTGVLAMVLLSRYYHRAKGAFAKAAELAGRESFIFFVCHWGVIWISASFSNIFLHNFNYWKVWVIQIPLNLFLSYKFTQLMAWWRDKTIINPGYAKTWLSILIICALIAVRADARGNIFLLKVFSFPASVAVAMVWPVGRNFIRGLVYRRQINAAKKAAE